MLHDGLPYDPSQGHVCVSHRGPKVAKTVNLKFYLLS